MNITKTKIWILSILLLFSMAVGVIFPIDVQADPGEDFILTYDGQKFDPDDGLNLDIFNPFKIRIYKGEIKPENRMKTRYDTWPSVVTRIDKVITARFPLRDGSKIFTFEVQPTEPNFKPNGFTGSGVEIFWTPSGKNEDFRVLNSGDTIEGIGSLPGGNFLIYKDGQPVSIDCTKTFDNTTPGVPEPGFAYAKEPASIKYYRPNIIDPEILLKFYYVRKPDPDLFNTVKKIHDQLVTLLPILKKNINLEANDINQGEFGISEEDYNSLVDYLNSEKVKKAFISQEPTTDRDINDIWSKLYDYNKKIKKGTKPAPQPPAPNPTPNPIQPSELLGLKLRISFFLDFGGKTPDDSKMAYLINIPEESKIFQGLRKGSLEDLDKLTQRLIEAVMKGAPEGYEADEESFKSVAFAYLFDQMKNDLEVRLVKKQEPGVLKNVVAFDIRNGEWVYERLYGIRMREGWTSVKDMAQAFYVNSDEVQANYLFAGFVTKDLEPCVVLREAYLEKPERWKEDYLKLLEETKADIVVLVVPKVMGITVEHIFPEGTQPTLMETVNVPYVEWASLQTSSQFMNLPEVFRTRIQKVNEQGFAFQEVRFYSGLEEVTGVLGAWDWVGMDLGVKNKKECKAKVFYQLAPENRVQAAGQDNVRAQVGAQAQSQAQANTQVQAQGEGPMQAQIKAQENQGPIAVAGASMSNEVNQVNRALPVTGEKDGLMWFISSVALLAAGLLLLNRH